MAVAKQVNAKQYRLVKDLIPAMQILKEFLHRMLIQEELISKHYHRITIIKNHKRYAGDLVMDRILVLIIRIIIPDNMLLRTIISIPAYTKYV